jgi:quinolinate synthase
MVCPNMKKTTAESVYNALKHMRYRIELEPDIIQRAQGALEAMLKV